ncbi:hypothetical protein FACS1894219_11090 [Clostridia bacterium]|nr:hypothetical protein FACS1894219_11090 [Clostridia bacterium]
MTTFLNENFLLTNKIAETIFHDYAKKLPIIDYHCHIVPREIAENRRFENIAEIWLKCGDHYKWRAIRANGFGEEFVTGSASDRDKFNAWAATLPRLAGNPLYTWTHMELKKYFGYGGVLNGDTAEAVWNLCNERLQSPDMSAVGIVRQSGVKVICTTDDPADSLVYHKEIKHNPDMGFVKVLPAFRPDKGLHIEKPGYVEYIVKLAEASGIDITSFESLVEAYRKRLDYFASLGCVTADNGFEYVPYVREGNGITADAILKKALGGGIVGDDEAAVFKTELYNGFNRQIF